MSEPIKGGGKVIELSDVRERLNRLETSQQETLIRDHAKDLRLLKIETDVAHMSDTLDKVLAGISRILWAIALAVLGSVTAFVLQGGFNIP